MRGGFKAYKFRGYSKRFPAFFAHEKKRLRRILPSAMVEHFGSSAVPNLGGKGIVDVMVSVPKGAVASSLRKLIVNGYEYIGTGGSKDREFLMRTVRSGGQERQVHVHLTHGGSYVGRSVLAVRDYLRRDKEAMMEYAEVKRSAVKRAGGEGERYRRLKKSFLDQLEKKALR